jgi:hypothetical protein
VLIWQGSVIANSRFYHQWYFAVQYIVKVLSRVACDSFGAAGINHTNGLFFDRGRIFRFSIENSHVTNVVLGEGGPKIFDRDIKNHVIRFKKIIGVNVIYTPYRTTKNYVDCRNSYRWSVSQLKLRLRCVRTGFSSLSGVFAGASLIQTIQEKGNWVFFVVELSMSPWKEYAPVLSRAVAPEEFLPIYQAANGLRAFIEFHQVVHTEIQAGKIDGSVEVSSLTFMSGMKQKLEEATVILVRLAETQKA